MSLAKRVVLAVLRPYWRYREWRHHWRQYVRYGLSEPYCEVVKSYWRGRRDYHPPWPLRRPVPPPA